MTSINFSKSGLRLVSKKKPLKKRHLNWENDHLNPCHKVFVLRFSQFFELELLQQTVSCTVIKICSNLFRETINYHLFSIFSI